MNLRIRDGCFHCYAVDVGRRMETHSQILQGQLPLCQAFSSKTLAVPGTSLPSSLRSVSLNPERFRGQLLTISQLSTPNAFRVNSRSSPTRGRISFGGRLQNGKRGTIDHFPGSARKQKQRKQWKAHQHNRETHDLTRLRFKYKPFHRIAEADSF